MNSIPGTSSARIVGEKASERGEERVELAMEETDGDGECPRRPGSGGGCENGDGGARELEDGGGDEGVEAGGLLAWGSS